MDERKGNILALCIVVLIIIGVVWVLGSYGLSLHNLRLSFCKEHGFEKVIHLNNTKYCSNIVDGVIEKREFVCSNELTDYFCWFKNYKEC